MSSYPQPHLHRVGLHSHGKRPFEECGGCDSDPGDAMPVQPTPSGTSSANPRCLPAGNPETRNKRARSTSSDASSSNPSSSSAYSTAQSSSHSDIYPDGPAVSPPSTQDVHTSDLHLPIPPPPLQRTHVPTPPAPEDSLRTSLQRFAEFDRHIAALRTSLAATRPPSLPPLGPSIDGDTAPSSDQWLPSPSNFLSNAGPASTVAVPPGGSVSSLSTSSDSVTVPATAPTASGSVPSASLPPAYSSVPRYPSYRPSTATSPSPAVHARAGNAVASTSTSFMRPPSNENPTRAVVPVECSRSDYNPHVRRTQRSLSPLVFPSDPPSSTSRSSVDTDDILFRRNADYSVPSPARELPLFRLEQQPPGLSSQIRAVDHARVIREHSMGRESVPSVFDVFNINESSQDRSRLSTVREPITSRYSSMIEPVPPRVPGSHNERPRGPAPTTNALNTNPAPPQNVHTRLHSSWTSIPSSNSLMSESASERQHTLALERFHARHRRSSFDADDESDSRWSSSSRGERENGPDLGVASPVPPSPSVESVPGTTTSSHFPPFGAMRAPQSTANRIGPAMAMSLQRSHSDLFAEAQSDGREEATDEWFPNWNAPRATERDGRERERPQGSVWEWERERQRERSGHDARGRGFTSRLSLTSTSSAREESSHPPMPVSLGPSRPPLGQFGAGPNMATHVTATTNNSQQYSYSNLNLSSFQSGLFRDSLRRNAEVDQASFSGGPVPSVIPGESRVVSRLNLEDSGSDMDSDDYEERRLRDAGDTPGVTPVDDSPPRRNFSPLPTFSVLRRDSMANYDLPARSQPNRNSTTFPRPIPPPGPARPTSFENNNRPLPPERAERDRFLPARILESFYRSHEDGRRNAPAGRHPYQSPHPHHALPSNSSVHTRHERNDVDSGSSRGASGNGHRLATEVVGEHRRSSLGSLRSRLARFAHPQSTSQNTHTVDVSSRQQSPPRPIGARPQVVEQRHRRAPSSVFGGPNTLEPDSRTDPRNVSMLGPPHWATNAGAGEPPVTTRDVPWRVSSGPRSAFMPPPLPSSSSARGEHPEVASRTEEQRSRSRSLRQRVFRQGGILRAAIGRRGNLGDYVPDELFDDSYEALLSLSSMLGEVRSRATPEEVIASLPTGTFREWKREDSETRCPICLDDYEPADVVTKLVECTHWLHKNCLEQWLRTANTCPVCREKVKTSPKPAPTRRRPHRDASNSSETNHGASSSGPSGRPPQANPQTNNGRPVSFAAIVLDRLMNDGREGSRDAWAISSSAPPAPPPPPPSTTARDAWRNALLDRLGAQQTPHPPPPHRQDFRDVYVPPFVSLPLEPPLRHRMPESRVESSTRPTPGGSSGSERAPGLRSLLREQGIAESTHTGPSSSMVVDEAGPSGRRLLAASNLGSLLDPPTMPRRETLIPFTQSSSGAFVPLMPMPPQPQQQPSFDAHGHGHAPPTAFSSVTGMVAHPRDRRNSSAFDPLLDLEARPTASSPASSILSGTQPRPTGMANRIPVEEDSSFEDYVFGWSLGRRVGREGTSSGV